jgi:hypothetical protein
MPLAVWTVNHAADVRWLLHCGVRTITSDRPDALALELELERDASGH